MANGALCSVWTVSRAFLKKERPEGNRNVQCLVDGGSLFFCCFLAVQNVIDKFKSKFELSAIGKSLLLESMTKSDNVLLHISHPFFFWNS